MTYEAEKQTNKDHVATPRWVVESGKIKAFALLLPLATLETPARSNMYERHKDKLSIIIFKKRIRFKGCATSFNKGCCWICYNIKNLKTLNWI